MESTIKDRLLMYIRHLGIGQRKFECNCGLSNGYVNNMRKSISPDKLRVISGCYPDLNTGWLMTGEGEMIKKETSTSAHEDIPIIPTELHKEPDVDLYKYTEDNQVSTAPIVPQFSKFDRFFYVTNDAMAPRVLASDMAAIKRIDSMDDLIPGALYMVDTKKIGALLRRVYDNGENLLLRSYNSQEYPDFNISKKDISNIARVVGIIRTNI